MSLFNRATGFMEQSLYYETDEKERNKKRGILEDETMV